MRVDQTVALRTLAKLPTLGFELKISGNCLLFDFLRLSLDGVRFQNTLAKQGVSVGLIRLLRDLDSNQDDDFQRVASYH
mgnify:CR=1 FL=1